MSLVWKVDLHSTDKFVLMYYADRASDDGTGVWPSVETISKATNFTTRTVQNATKKLIHSGYISFVGWTKYRTKLLKINVEYLSEKAKETEDAGIMGAIKDNERRTKFTQGVNKIHHKSEIDSHKPSITINKPSINRKGNKFGYVSENSLTLVDQEMKNLLRNAFEKTNTNQESEVEYERSR